MAELGGGCHTIMRSVSIPCPCGGEIPVGVDLLLGGTKFNCPTCQATVSMASTSRQVAADAIDDLKHLKESSGETVSTDWRAPRRGPGLTRF